LTGAGLKASLADGGREHLILIALPRPPQRPERDRAGLELMFAGLCFRLHGAEGLLAGLMGAPHTVPRQPDLPAPLARVDCELEATSRPPPQRQGGHPIEWSWQGARGQVQTHHVQARLEQLEPRQFRLRAGLPGDPVALSTLFSAVTPALVHALGGTVLHAASVELGGGVIAFVGPSAAGKSTACGHTATSLCFSLDRLAVVPSAQGWVACALPGGKGWEQAGARSGHSVLPLRAVLRVVQSQLGPRIFARAGHARLALLRQATFHGARVRALELELLGALDALGQALPTGQLEFALGDALAPVIEAFIQGRSES
jgi:hypothetical protein